MLTNYGNLPDECLEENGKTFPRAIRLVGNRFSIDPADAKTIHEYLSTVA